VKNHYISEYLKLKCSGQLQELFSQSANPYKEITESMSAWKNIKEYIDIKDKTHTCIFIGDGSLCLTGALFAFLIKGKCISVDPNINIEKMEMWNERENPRHFQWFKGKYQEIDMQNQRECYDLILVHAHVELEELVSHLPAWRYLYTNPCCKPQDQTFSVQFQTENNISILKAGYDKSSLSPKNMVFLYKNNKQGREVKII
jgi:hypothetical protein